MSGETHEAVHRHEAPTSFIRKYIFSLDHKVIGIQYIILALAAVLVGMTMSVLMRLNLSWPGTSWPILGTLFPTGAPGGIMNPEFYLSLVTMHGTIMVFFVLTTAPQGGFGNYFLPIQIGAEDMAFPVLNMMSFWVTLVGFLVILAAIFVEGNVTIANSALGLALGGASGATVGPIGGWTGYAPLSAVGIAAGPGQGAGMNLWIVSIAIFCVGSLLGALNFITTLLNMRTRGMTLMRMPLTCWAWFTTAVLALLSFPVLLGGGILLLLDRTVGTSFFVPGGLVFGSSVLNTHTGGSPILWQHLFWFFGHPEVYIAILPGMGATSHILSTFARKPVFGYRAMVFAIFAIGLLGFFVWGHHMFISGMSPYSAMTFSILTLSIGVPSAVKTFNWLGTLWGAQDSLHDADAVCDWFCFAVCGRRHHRPGAGPDFARLAHARHLLCAGPLPPGDGRGLDLRHVCRDLFLVSEDVWSLHERAAGQNSLLDNLRRRLLHLRSHAHDGHGGHAASVFTIYGV